MEAAGVALGDVMRRKGVFSGGPKPPFTPGYDIVGRIEAKGEGVSGFHAGDRVAVCMDGIGGYSEYVRVQEQEAVPVLRKNNLLPQMARRGTNGARLYAEADLRFIQFLLSLKQTGMPLTDIAHFVKDGCLLVRAEADNEELASSVQTRLNILQQHLKELEARQARLSEIMGLTREKIDFYSSIGLK